MLFPVVIEMVFVGAVFVAMRNVTGSGVVDVVMCFVVDWCMRISSVLHPRHVEPRWAGDLFYFVFV